MAIMCFKEWSHSLGNCDVCFTQVEGEAGDKEAGKPPSPKPDTEDAGNGTLTNKPGDYQECLPACAFIQLIKAQLTCALSCRIANTSRSRDLVKPGKQQPACFLEENVALLLSASRHLQNVCWQAYVLARSTNAKSVLIRCSRKTPGLK